MRQSIAGMIAIGVSRATLLILSGIVMCIAMLAAIGFALLALYSALTGPLGPAGAAFATSCVALALPVAIMAATLVATRTWISKELATTQTVDRSTLPTRSEPTSGEPASHARIEALGLEQTLGWISQNPKSATLSALSFGIALGAYPDLRKTLLNGVDTALDQNRAALH